jgi:glycosyltransferase involved in cell wall biosynthesis
MFGAILAVAATAVLGSKLAADKVLSVITTAPSPLTVITDGPLVSVIIPAYNEEKYLPSLLSALSNQTYLNLEVIVVDDSSTDNTAAIAVAAGATVISHHSDIVNVSSVRNKGAAAASGSILIFNDADSIPQQDLIALSVDMIEQQQKVMVYCNHCCTDSLLMGAVRVLSGIADPGMVTVNGQYIAITKEAFSAVGGFDESTAWIGEDQQLFRDVADYYGPDCIGYLRWAFSATSARRQKAQGLLNPDYDNTRAIRKNIEARRG